MIAIDLFVLSVLIFFARPFYQNPAKLLGPRGIVTIPNNKPFPIGVIDRKGM